MFKRSLQITGILIIFVFSGCTNVPEKIDIDELVNGSEEEVEEPVITFSDNHLEFNDNETKTIEISLNKEVEEDVQWEVLRAPFWAVTDPDSGTIGNDPVEIKVTTDIEDLGAGSYFNDIEFITENGENSKLKILLVVSVAPEIEISPETLIFSEGETNKKITITNTGTGLLKWEIRTHQKWIKIDNYNDLTSNGESTEVLISVDRTGFEEGIFTGYLILTTNADEEDIYYEVSMEVRYDQ